MCYEYVRKVWVALVEIGCHGNDIFFSIRIVRDLMLQLPGSHFTGRGPCEI